MTPCWRLERCKVCLAVFTRSRLPSLEKCFVSRLIRRSNSGTPLTLFSSHSRTRTCHGSIYRLSGCWSIRRRCVRSLHCWQSWLQIHLLDLDCPGSMGATGTSSERKLPCCPKFHTNRYYLSPLRWSFSLYLRHFSIVKTTYHSTVMHPRARYRRRRSLKSAKSSLSLRLGRSIL